MTRDAVLPDVVRYRPSTVAEALDLHLHITALEGWLADRRREVVGWVETRAMQRVEEDGAAPTWRLPDGTVLLTDPQPTPRIADAASFGPWYVERVLGGDPGRREPLPEAVTFFDDAVAVRRVPRVPPEALLSFVDGYLIDERAAAWTLVEAITVDEEWLAGDELLAELLAGKREADPSGTARLAVDGEAVIDRLTGERVPGCTVAPPGRRIVQMRPSGEAKARARTELDVLLGRPALVEESATP